MPRRLDATLLEALLAAEPADLARATDADLLRRYADAGDEAAFAVLARRHAGMVLAACRRVLGHAQDAEDACQAAFLLLARKARGGAWRASVAGWLYAAARQVALNARRRNDRRARHERRAEAHAVTPPLDQLSAAELLAALDEELARLPERYRAPLVLCCLEGLTRDEAARRLGMPSATLKSQLERGRRLLASALERRGVTLGAGFLALTVASPAEAASPGLVGSVVAAMHGGASPAVAALVEEVAVSGWTKRLLWLGAAMVLVGGVCAAPLLSGGGTPTAAAPADAPPTAPPAAKPDAAELVRKVRASQAWLHKAKSFAARLEGKRTNTATGKVLPESYEIAFDSRRLRHVWASKGLHEHERVWDGQRSVQRFRLEGREQLALGKQRDDVASEMLGGLFWLWLHPHAFWWSRADGKNEWGASRETMGEPGDFVVTGREVYRGVPCVVLHKKDAQLLRYYVGEKTGLLHGLMSGARAGNPQAGKLAAQLGARHGKTLRTEREVWDWIDGMPKEKRMPVVLEWFALCQPTERPRQEVWMLDYKEVKPGCWFPMTQASATYYDERDVRRKAVPTAGTFDRPTADVCELRAVSLTVDQPLAAGTFTPPAPSEGAWVDDRWGDVPLSYTYRKTNTPEVMKALQAEAKRQQEQEAKEKARRDELVGTAALAFPKAEWLNSKPLTWQELKGKSVVLLFWAEGCGPCHAYKGLLRKMTDKDSVVFIGVHAAGATRAEVEKALKADEADGPVVIDTKGEGDAWAGVLLSHYRLNWIPSAVLIDPQGKVRSLGHVKEVIDKLRPADESGAKK